MGTSRSSKRNKSQENIKFLKMHPFVDEETKQVKVTSFIPKA